MQGESIYMKTQAMEDKTKDYEAEMELQKLEESLGMRPAPEARRHHDRTNREHRRRPGRSCQPGPRGRPPKRGG